MPQRKTALKSKKTACQTHAVLIPPADPIHVSRFARMCEAAMLQGRGQGEAGIGTLQEKRLHQILKRFICDNEDYHEVGVANTRYVSDVRIGNLIFEVQTGAFYPMKQKIAHYLANTDCVVTVVHPIAVTKWISWIDPKTHEIAPRVRSPKKGCPEDLLPQLYCLLPHLQNPRLRYQLLFLEVEDFRFLDGRRSRDRKRGSTKYERIPLSLVGEMELNSTADFARFIPEPLPEHFTVKEFSSLTKLRGRDAYSAVRVLTAMGFFEESEKIGRSMGWQRLDHKQFPSAPCAKA